MNIRKEIQSIESLIIDWRRDFHRHPELSFKEFRTAEVITAELQSMGLNPKINIGKTGLFADLKFGDGPMIALRADMDALPIEEIYNGSIRFIFQPAEEGKGGAEYMIRDGCLNGVDEIYGIHVWNYQPLGEIGVKNGPVMAAADMFNIKIKGIGGHGAAPQGTVDAIVVSSHLIQALQTIVSRNTNPIESTVVTIGQINGGHNFNIISDEVNLTGTARAYTEENRQLIKSRMIEIIKGIESTFKAKIELDYTDGYPPTVNHKKQTSNVLKAASQVVGEKAKEPYLSMGGEDFAYYLQKTPGCFFFIGSAPNKSSLLETPHHCSHFDMDERALLIGPSVYLNLIDNLLKA